ncbi:O-acetyl-ADP-ribose deacetylase [Methanococcoides sp. NM1]|uniref:O-acetyl-ADP-ribose deacetylase n=1 Tax=Methanococcoides sp. NM1 TaxID=1201013 RepID=UPI001083686E|nr:O-acetyl-ADP-ribose deacetylase [Methanococcoides sp. NM1]
MLSDRIVVTKGDIVELDVDAIVNAANNSLLGGGGVDGAIHAAAGPQLLEECRSLKGCPTGEAKITSGYLLPAKWVIHTVGPIWRGGTSGEDEMLARCYRNSLKLAERNGVRTIAFPSISTGAYGFPVDRASRIAITEIAGFLGKDSSIEKVLIVCFNERTFDSYSRSLEELVAEDSHN